jgi:hypothetical protein
MPQDWEAVYRAAVLEMDRDKMAERIDVAISVLTGRLLEAGSSPEHNIERRRIVDALPHSGCNPPHRTPDLSLTRKGQSRNCDGVTLCQVVSFERSREPA